DDAGSSGANDGEGTGATGGDATETADATGEGAVVEVTIARDEHGVPHVSAATDAAAFYGLGWATAEDRLLQMNLSVMAAQGRLAEIVGPDAVAGDRAMRIMGTWRHAQAAADLLPADHRALLDAYAQGVNDWIAAHPGALEPAFTTLELSAQEWSAAHCLATWVRMGNFFATDADALVSEADTWAEFAAVEAELGTEAAIEAVTQDSHPGEPAKGVVQAADVPADVQQAIADYAVSMGYGDAMGNASPHGFAAAHPHYYGKEGPKFSHAWAVGGAMTATGEAALVSDPQLAVTAPNFLYEFEIEGDTVHARGAGPAGAPALLIGFTPYVAWGLTAAVLDQRDLFRLQMTDATHYTVDGEAHEITAEDEVIAIAGGGSENVTYRASTWGPIVTDLIPNPRGEEYAMKGLPFSEPERDTFLANVAMMRAHDMTELRAAIEDWRFPTANFVGAATGGHVFYTVVGAIPVRSTSSPLGGMMAQDGSSLAHDWQDTIPGDMKPWVLDPAAGFVFSANHRPVGDWYPLPLGGAFAGDTNRSRRLRERLVELSAGVGAQDVLDDVQWDCVNPGARDLVGLGLHIRAVAPAGLRQSSLSALDVLAPWHAAGAEATTGNPGTFLASVIDLKFRPDVTGPTLAAAFGGGESGLSFFLDTMMAQIAADPGFVPDADTIDYIDNALAGAWQTATNVSDDPADWEPYHAEHVATMTMPYLVTLDIPDPITDDVVVAPMVQCAEGSSIWSQRGESYTQWIDFADVDASRSLLPLGNPQLGELSTSQQTLWSAGSLKPALLSAGAIAEAAQHVETIDYQP
ncbi:MAG TPA: penicillin acylase family protein, partial [Nannocystaceae bacterium]|nr:penicillin acylase family protein [Nannocystaceae bacterium]